MRLRVFLSILSVLFLAAGCARLGESYEHADLPPGAPLADAVLAELGANESAVAHFRATGEFMLRSPELAGTQALRQSSMYFRYPADLHVIGRKYTSVVLKLTCAGPAFIMEFPTEKEYIFREQGEFVPELDAAVTPAWIVRELFRPEDWSALPPERVRMVEYEEAAQRTVIEILRADAENAVERRLELTGPPWVLRKSELFAADGTLLAETTKEDYRLVDGVWFPAVVETRFPRTGAYMRIAMRKVFLNEPPDEGLFDLDAVLQYLHAEKYRRVEFYEDVRIAP